MRHYPIICLLVLLSSPGFSQQLTLKTNTLFWLTGTPNVGAEVGAGHQFTFGVWGAYNAWKYPDAMKLNLYAVEAEARYWFCRKFEGHFVGVHGQYGHFNIGQMSFLPSLKEHVLRGDLYGGGITYGYHWALGERWGLEAMLGLGYLRLKYEKLKCAECGERVGRYDHNYYGPTRAGVSLIYFLH